MAEESPSAMQAALQGSGLLNDAYLKEYLAIERQKAEDTQAQLERRPARNMKTEDSTNG